MSEFMMHDIEFDPELDDLLRKIITADKQRKTRPKSCLKTYLYASDKGRHYGALPNYPRHDIIGEPTINNYWYSADMVPCASAFGIGSCMQCTYIPDALASMAEGIEQWLINLEAR